jgi:hypothetical protein
MGFESTIAVFEREKTIHALARAATVTGCHPLSLVSITEELLD